MGLVEVLLQTYPDCDRMMAETLVKMHEQGRLQDFMGGLRDELEVDETQVVKPTAIEIQNPQEK